MTYVLILTGLTVGAAPPAQRPQVELADIARFGPYLKEDLERKQEIINRFLDYALNHLDPATQIRASRMSGAISSLRALKNPRNDPDLRLAELHLLRQELGDEAYQKGQLPELYPAKHRAGFLDYLKKKGIKLDP